MKGITGESRGIISFSHTAYSTYNIAESERYLSSITRYNNNWEKILTIDILRVLIISICAPNFFPVLPPSGTNSPEACSMNVTWSRFWCILMTKTSVEQNQNFCKCSSTAKYYGHWIYYVTLDYGRAACIISSCNLSFLFLHFLTASSTKKFFSVGNNDKFWWVWPPHKKFYNRYRELSICKHSFIYQKC